MRCAGKAARLLTVLLYFSTLSACTREPEPPAALWRNGVIVHVDHCDAPADEQSLLRCAGLHCARRVTELLTNAQQARLHITRAEWREPGRTIRIEGTISQYLHIPTLPQGFACTVPAGASQVEPEMLFNTPHEQPSTTAVGHAPPPHGP